MFRRRAAILAAITAAILLLGSGCASPPSTPSPSPSLSPSPSPSPSASPDSEAITFQSPEDGATVTVPVSARGTANTFEAALTVDAINEAGDIMCIRHIMATSGSGTPGTWETVLGFAPQDQDSDFPATIRAYEFSPEDGAMINLVERQVSVSPERPAIMLTSPICGDTVAPGGALAIQGLATVFEAALTVELRDASGAAVFARNLMTADGSVESSFGEFVTIPSDLPGGFYDVVAFSYSPEDGSIENEFPVQISVAP